MIIDGYRYTTMQINGRWRALCGAFVAYGATQGDAIANCRAKVTA